MALIRREPIAASVRRRDVEDFGNWPFGGGFDWALRPFETWRHLFGEDQVSVEEFIEDGHLVVRADLPGVDPDRDVDISVVDGNLQIRAERRQEEREEQRNYRRTEIRYGSFRRTLPLPPGTNEEDIEASYRDGILEVRAPVTEHPSEPSKIPIKRS